MYINREILVVYGDFCCCVCQVGYPPFWNDKPEFLLLSILQANYTFPSPYWDTVSEPAKDLIKKMVTIYIVDLKMYIYLIIVTLAISIVTTDKNVFYL